MINSFHKETPEVVKILIRQAHDHDRKIRIWYGDRETGRSWMEENGVLGWVGCSTGRFKIPLIITHPNNMGGGALLDHCIVRLDARLGENWVTQYEHPSFYIPDILLRKTEDPDDKYVVEAIVDGDVHARFQSWPEAYQWAGFMLGVHHEWPQYIEGEDEEDGID